MPLRSSKTIFSSSAAFLIKPDAAHDELHAIFLDDFAADVQIASGDGIHDLLQRDAERAHFRRDHFDLILPHEAADARDFGDALHGVELVANEPILQRREACPRS